MQAIFHADKELGVAEVAREIGVPFVFSTMSSSTLEEVAGRNGREGVRWFQLYWPREDEVTIPVSSLSLKMW